MIDHVNRLALIPNLVATDWCGLIAVSRVPLQNFSPAISLTLLADKGAMIRSHRDLPHFPTTVLVDVCYHPQLNLGRDCRIPLTHHVRTRDVFPRRVRALASKGTIDIRLQTNYSSIVLCVLQWLTGYLLKPTELCSIIFQRRSSIYLSMICIVFVFLDLLRLCVTLCDCFHEVLLLLLLDL